MLSWKHIPGVQPTMTIDEQVECEQAVLASPEFKAALKKHYGIDDTRLVMVDIWSAGNYGSGRRPHAAAGAAAVFPAQRPDRQRLRRPIEGLRPVVDLNTMKVIRVEEYGHWPLPPQQANYAADRVTKTRTTSSRWRSRSRTGRASRSTATRCAGRSGASSSASTPAKG